jgi:hypothetical protein
VSNLLSLLSMFLSLLLSMGLDQWLHFLKANNSASFQLDQLILWTSALVFLILSISLLGLFWYLHFRAERSRLIAAIFLFTGLILIFLPAATMTSFGALIPSISQNLAPGSPLFISSAFIAAIGVLSLLLPRMRD